MKFLLDENLSSVHARELRAQAYDAVSVVESGLSGASDERVRDFAISSGRILITLDADFANIIRFPPAKTPGVIRLRLPKPTEERIASTLSWTLYRVQDLDLRGRLVVATESKIRVRSGLG